jgi:protocatechuate 3,4-dioxygenase beta subunit
VGCDAGRHRNSIQENHLHAHAHGECLADDLKTLAQQRRSTLLWLGAGVMALAGCGGGGGGDDDESSSSSSTSSTTTTSTTSTTSSTCSTIPSETAGPYPGDGTNTVNGSTANALTQSGIVRSTIVASFGSASGSADGVPLTIQLKVVNTSSSCASLAGYAVYLWHCDQLGRYSMYSSGITGENYLRGVQVTDSDGAVTFTSIFPGCYSGRWPHIHFEVFASLSAATSGNNDVKTSQIALPQAAATAVYADSRYTGSSANLASVTLATDNVFSDGATLETPSVSGSNSAGWVISLQVGVAA